MKKIFKGTLVAILGAGTVFLILFSILPLPGDIPILLYHFVDTPVRAAHEKNVVSRESFSRQMEFLDRWGYRVITLDQFYEIKTGRRKPRGREIVITFDDGNYTFADQAFPILEQHRFPAAVFVISDNVKNNLQGSMTEETIRKMISSGIVTIGSHSKSHPLLSQLPDQAAGQELLGSKRELEAMLGIPIFYFAYPSGDLNPHAEDLVSQAGYRLAFTTSYKKLRGGKETQFSMTRIKVTRSADFILAFWGEVSGLYSFFKRLLA